MWPSRKKSIGVRSIDMGGHATGLPCQNQQSLLSGSDMLILKRILLPVSLKQQRPGIFESHVSLCYRGQEPSIWTYLIWYKIQLFFIILQWFCLISNLSQTHFDGPWHCKDAWPTYSCLTINFCFGLSYHLMKFGHGVFCTPVFRKEGNVLHF